MLIPFMIIIWQKDVKWNIRQFFKLSIPMGIVAIALYAPIYIQFGSSFFMYYDQFPYPPFTKVMYKMIIGVFGFIGTLSLAVFSMIAFLKRKERKSGENRGYNLDKKIRIASYVLIVLYCISYFRLPQKS